MLSRSRTAPRFPLQSNLLWLIGAAILAFLVWVTATMQFDPITEQRFPVRIPIQLTIDPNMTVVNQQTTSVWVMVRAQQSVHEDLAAEDIIVSADLSGLQPGRHTVELDARLARRGVVDTQPRQITVTLERIQSQQVPVVVVIPPELDLPANFVREDPVLSETQAAITGVAQQVQRVTAVQATLDLRNLRNSFSTDVSLIPVDADGQPVSDVEVNPGSVTVQMDIRRRDDVREISVSPSFDPGTLPEGYTVRFSYSPQTVFLVGSRQRLEAVQGPLTTETIDLTDRREDFQVTVPVKFPDGETFPVLGESAITVFFEISAQTTTRQFDSIPVEVIGLDGLSVDLSLDRVVVLVTGPEQIVQTVTTEDIQVVVDVNGLLPGTYELVPQVSVAVAEISPADVSVNPAAITVTVRDTNTSS